MALRLGTRSSQLAILQSEEIHKALEARGRSSELVMIKTESEGPVTRPAGAMVGRFTHALEQALLKNEIDLAVHSLKDLPTESHPQLMVPVVTRRLPCEDVLISKTGMRLAQLPSGAKVGTSSPRRQAQILTLRQDLRIVPLHGNVDTRLKKLRETDLDAIVLARAGLMRLGRESEAMEILPLEKMLPAPGQGSLAVQIRKSDTHTMEAVLFLDDDESRRTTSSEREFLQALGGGCQIPVGAWARIDRGRLILTGSLISLDGKVVIRDEVQEPVEDSKPLGRTLAKRFLDRGAKTLVEEWRRQLEER